MRVNGARLSIPTASQEALLTDTRFSSHYALRRVIEPV